MSRSVALVVLLFGSLAVGAPWPTPLPAAAQTTPTISARPTPPATALAAVRFAVIGDNGTGDQPEFDVARQMIAFRTQVPFEFVIMLGDNLYGRPSTRKFADAFERP